MALASRVNRPPVQILARLLELTESQRVEVALDEECEEMVDGNVRRRDEEDRLRDAEVGLEKVDDGDDRCGLARPRRLDTGQHRSRRRRDRRTPWMRLRFWPSAIATALV